MYSDKVLPGSKIQREFSDSTSQLSVIAPPASVTRSGHAQPRVAAQAPQRDELWRERNLAQAALDAARGAKASGEEPLPNDRTANATGGSRLNEAYWARQDALDRAIDGAQRNLERAEQRLREAGG